MIPYEDIMREFQKEKAKYLLVGGMATNLHGFARNTADMDILVEMSDKNLAKVVTILKKKGYSVKQPVDPMGIADKKIRGGWIKNKNMKAFNFYKHSEHREIDIIIDSPVSYEKAKGNAIQRRVGSLSMPVISLKDLIKMKKKSGRDLDMMDVERLVRIKKMSGTA